MKKYVVMKPYQGLINQLLSITWSLEIGEICDRDVKIDSFQPNFNQYKIRIPITNVIDIDLTNQKLRNKGYHVQISDLQISPDVLSEFDSVIKPKPALKFKKLEQAIEVVKKSDLQEFHVGYSFYSKSRYKSDIFDCLTFKRIFYDTVEDICKELNLKIYSSVHLRIEKDSIQHIIKKFDGKFTEDQMRETLIEKYCVHFESLQKRRETIFVASNLLKCQDPANDQYLQLKRKYNLIDTSSLDYLYNKVGEGRELRAIIDFLICRQSQRFFGINMSSFSDILSKLLDSEIIVVHNIIDSF